MNRRQTALPLCPLPWALFLFFFLFYLIANGGHLGAYDAAMEYEVTKNLIRDGSFELKDEQFDEVSAARGRDGKLYSPHGLGQSIAMIPFYFLGEVTTQLLPRFPEMRTHHFFISLMNPLITAITCAILFLLQRRLGFDEKVAVSGTCVYGLFTLAFPYAKLSFDVTLTASLLLGAAYAAYRFRQTSHYNWALLAGTLLGSSLLTRIATLIVLPLFTTYFYFCLRNKGRNSSETAKHVVSFGLPIVVFLIIVGWYNAVRFGTFYEDGHAADAAVKFTTPFLVGLGGQLLSPGKGLLLYSPVLIFSLLGIKRLYRTHRRESLLFGCIILVNLFFYSKLANWSGDWCWGPRFTVPIVPFISLFVGAFLSGGGLQRSRGLKRVWAIILVVSFAVQILGVTINGPRRIGRRYTSGDVTPSQLYWHPAESPLVDHAGLLSRLSFNTTRMGPGTSHEIQQISYADTTPDFWFIYLYSIGFPLRSILICGGFLIIFDIYFGYSIFRTVFRSKRKEC